MRTLHLPALCTSINEATRHLDHILEDACDACGNSEDSVQAWHCTLDGGVDATELWQEIMRGRPRAVGVETLMRLAPVPEAGCVSVYASMTLYRLLPGEPVNAALSYMGEWGPCYCAQWGGEDIPASPDLEIVSESTGLVSVRWSPRAERWLHVADGIACHAIRFGADMGISEEDYPIEN